MKKALESAKRLKFQPFGDVANRLFVCLPLPAELPADSKERAKYLDHIKRFDDVLLRVNRRSVVMDWPHLRDIPSVVAIAGGTETSPKTHALWTLSLAGCLLPGPKSRGADRFGLITSLITNDYSAGVLMRAHADLEARMDKEMVLEWYSQALHILFPDGA